MSKQLDIEARFNYWFDENRRAMIECEISEHLAKTIWMAGQTVGYQIGFNEGRKLGIKEGTDDFSS